MSTSSLLSSLAQRFTAYHLSSKQLVPEKSRFYDADGVKGSIEQGLGSIRSLRWGMIKAVDILKPSYRSVSRTVDLQYSIP